MKYLSGIFTVIPFLFFYGCAAVGPDYVRPETAVAEKWHTPLQDGVTSERADPLKMAVWWRTFKDPDLTALIERAVGNNLDLKMAQARLREARARRGLAKTDLYPTVDASTQASRSETDRKSGTDTETHFYSAGLDASWEIDIFGGTRRSIEAADADISAAGEALNDQLVSLSAETALNYIELRTYQTRLAAAEANLKIQKESCDLTRWRYEAGLDDELSLQQALSNLETTQAQVPNLRTGLEETKNRLAVLLGEQPGAVHHMLKEQRPIPFTPLELAVGVPADVLRQRPDIRRAERELAAQTARIGVAVAEYYPKFTLFGSIGLETLSLKNMSTMGSSTISFGPRIAWRVFDAGAVRRRVEVQSAIQEQYLLAYEAAIQGALEEVENRLTAYAEEQVRRTSLSKATEAAKEVARLAKHKYEAGLTDFSAVLDAERSLLSLQDQLAQSEGIVTANGVRLYKALGGGWTPLGATGKITKE
ncbi:MAG: efflux transporter outer membrane subunit [Deltaproteobacteria bacterium]|nr:efflux transporter outer membrane subunit [Deltaproteobacteria bacterium]